MAPLIQRQMQAPIREALRYTRVVNVVGPRQSGKSTLVRSMVSTAAYHTLDDDGLRELLDQDPYGQLLHMRTTLDPGEPLVIDEVQRLPQLTMALKRIVDDDPVPGRFLLTGSSDILASRAAMDSLAGRVLTLHLYPLSAAERCGKVPLPLLDLMMEGADAVAEALPGLHDVDRSALHSWITQGGYPDMMNLPDRARRLRHASYLDSVIDRDVPALSPIRKPDAFRRTVEQLAARLGQELNLQSICNAVDTSRDTVAHWLDILEGLHLVRRLDAWSYGHTRREVRSPKLHFVDTGLACSLRGVSTDDLLLPRDPLLVGSLIENFVWAELTRALPLHHRPWRLYHWRRDRREIDIVAEAPGGRLVLMEVKASAQVGREDARHLQWFMTEGPGKDTRATGAVLYLGNRILPLGPNLVALPIAALWA